MCVVVAYWSDKTSHVSFIVRKIYVFSFNVESIRKCRTEMSTGLELNWTRTIENFVEFGLDPD